MDNQSVIGVLGALAQETRLAIFRELVKAHSPRADTGGLAAGTLAEKLGIGASALSFHLKEMQWNGLIASRKDGRSVIYRADLGRVRSLVTFLLEDCCGGACGVSVVRDTCTGDKQ